MSSTPSRVVGLFPTPVLHAERLLDPDLVAALVERFAEAARQANRQSAQLSHTAIVSPDQDLQLSQVSALVGTRLAEFGELLFGERQTWRVKEMWFNVLETGGHQALHNHANSFVSGVLYLTPGHADWNTTFVRPLRQEAFVSRNTHAGSHTGPFNADKWVMPATGAGDLVLFPSGLLHEVPPNRGARRITLAFNAIPERLDAWGYRIGFSS